MWIRTYYEGECSLGTKFKTAMSSIFDYWSCYLKRNSNNTQSILSFSKTQLDSCSSAAFFGILQTISKVLGRVFDSFPNRLNDFQIILQNRTLRYLRKVSYSSKVYWDLSVMIDEIDIEESLNGGVIITKEMLHAIQRISKRFCLCGLSSLCGLSN